MFNDTSRYAPLETVEWTSPEGEVIRYQRRRFPPPADRLNRLVDVTVSADDRLDLIAARTLGDPEQFWRICDANSALNPADLLELGRTLTVPMPQIENA